MSSQSLEMRTIVVDPILYKESVRSLLTVLMVAAETNAFEKSQDEVLIAGLECLNILGVPVDIVEEIVEEERW